MTTSSSQIVYIVDDDEDMRLAMQRILKTVNLRAELFATAQEFLQRGITDVPSCLVLDVRFPEWADSRSSRS
jgi:FixJ family two-component response regulator